MCGGGAARVLDLDNGVYLIASPNLSSRAAKYRQAHDRLHKARHDSIFRRGELISAGTSTESFAVFKRLDEGAHHLSSLRAIESLRIVAHVLTRRTELVQFSQPEVVASEIQIWFWRVIWIASEITEVLHQNECTIGLGI